MTLRVKEDEEAQEEEEENKKVKEIAEGRFKNSSDPLPFPLLPPLPLAVWK